MKWSIYNELIEDLYNKDCIYLFNALRENYFILDIELRDLIILGKSDVKIIAEEHPELYNCLLFEKFILPDDYDEIDDCLQKLNEKFSFDGYLRITINPTLDCNLRCWYCYENHIKGSCMRKETIEALVKLIENKAKSDSLKRMQLSFFGGEPLIKFHEIVKPIIEKGSEICNKYKKELMVGITTNGVCLTPAVIKDLKKITDNIGIQVTLDGNKQIHDSVKFLKNGKGSYDTVKQNLIYAINNGVMTTIRCNYTLENIDSFIDLLDDFSEYSKLPNVRCTFNKVWQENESKELQAKREQIRRIVVEKYGFKSNINSYNGDSIIPCYADYNNNIVVNYNGDVYKCTARDFKPENRLGKLSSTGEIIYNNNAEIRNEKKYTKQCYKCKMLPICTICFQKRSESADRCCPVPQAYENAVINIHKYFYDVLAMNNA